MEKSVLVIDDEEDIRILIRYNLEQEGFVVYEASTGEDGIKMAKKHIPDLILLDVMMPEMDGIATCEKIREIPQLKNVMVSFLTARGEDYSQIAGFEAGADDYITKPIKPKILLSRITAMLRRQHSISTPVATNEDQVTEKIVIDHERYKVYVNGESISLPRKEFELLSLLMSKPGKVFHRDTIMNKVWGTEVVVGDRTIDVHVRKLREKLGKDLISTIKGVGYKIEEHAL